MFQVLLLEDDAVSAAFLAEALSALPANVQHSGSVRAAIASAGARAFDLLVFDARLPDGSGIDALTAIRARSLAPALALSAELDAATTQALLAAGFAAALAKPVSSGVLLRAARALLAEPAGATALAWDDERGLSALGGRIESLRALRALFLRELPAQITTVREALQRGDDASATAELHKLKASCGFVGAAALLLATQALARDPDSAAASRDFFAQAQRLLDRPVDTTPSA